MAITAEMVKALREKTGLPMMECKKALAEAGGDAEQAIELLKKAGSAKISKMSSRETSQGRIACFVDDQRQRAGIAELLCETAPVASTDDFKQLANMTAQQAAMLDGPTPEAVLGQPCPSDTSKTIDEFRHEVFNRLRENMNLKRVASLKGNVAHYVHHNSQVGVIMSFNAACPAELQADLCMHIAAMNPPYLKRDDVDPKLVEEERERAAESAKGKPPQIVEKIVSGKLDRWYGEIVLLEQPFVKDDKQTVTQVLMNVSPDLTIDGFVRYHVGGA
ncbi:MAG: translation elongation factor Ts [Phycisphaerae bacterium]|nr:translation elongation factor Ts [Phycisphaerae bacterium]